MEQLVYSADLVALRSPMILAHCPKWAGGKKKGGGGGRGGRGARGKIKGMKIRIVELMVNIMF